MDYRVLAATMLVAGTLGAQTPEELRNRGITALQSNDLQQAVTALEHSRAMNSGDGRTRLGLAAVYRLLDRPYDADAEIAAVSELASEDPELLRGLSVYYEHANDPEEAARFESAYVQTFPDDITGYGRAAAFHLEAGNPQLAVEYALSGLERAEMASLYGILGSAHADLKQVDLAREDFGNAIRLRPYDEDYRYDLGYVSLQAQRFDEALAAFDEARKVFDKSARIELGRGTALYGLRSFSDALDAFIAASQLAPGAPQPHYFLGRMIEHAGDRVDEILERQRNFAETEPDNYLAPFLHAQALLASLPPTAEPAVFATAEKLLRTSISFRDDYWESHFELGQLLEQQKRYEEAEAPLLRAVELNPNSSKPQYRLSRVYARLGKTELAEAARQRHQELTEAERAAIRSSLGGEPTLP